MATTIHAPTTQRAPSRSSNRLLLGVAAVALAAGAFQLGRVEVHQDTTNPPAPASATSPAPITGPSAAAYQIAQDGLGPAPVYGCTPTERVHAC
jgi:hypothetical protein